MRFSLYSSKTFYIVSSILAFVLVLSTPLTQVYAATLLFNPSSGSFQVGDRFNVDVLVTSTDQEMNAVSAEISFPTELVELVSVSQTGTLVDFWAREPSFSNVLGTANLEGVLLSGFQGSNGRIVRLVFEGKQPGTVPLVFNSGSVLANDGLGTSILSGLGEAALTLTAGPVAGPVTGAPNIISSTHPEQDKWYSISQGLFSWNLPEEVDDVDVIVTREKEPEFDDSNEGLGRISEFTIDNVTDGTWYLHAIFKQDSVWGDVSTFQFNVDTTPPEPFVIQEVYSSAPSTESARFAFEAQDETSGIAFYRIVIDNNIVEDWTPEAAGEVYETQKLRGGSHTLIVTAFDQAGNKTTSTIEFGITIEIGVYIYTLLAIIFILLVLLAILYHRYVILERNYKALVDTKEVQKHMKRDLRMQERLKKEALVILKLKKDLGEMESRIETNLAEIERLKIKEDPVPRFLTLFGKKAEKEVIDLPKQTPAKRASRKRAVKRKVQEVDTSSDTLSPEDNETA